MRFVIAYPGAILPTNVRLPGLLCIILPPLELHV